MRILLVIMIFFVVSASVHSSDSPDQQAKDLEYARLLLTDENGYSRSLAVALLNHLMNQGVEAASPVYEEYRRNMTPSEIDRERVAEEFRMQRMRNYEQSIARGASTWMIGIAKESEIRNQNENDFAMLASARYEGQKLVDRINSENQRRKEEKERKERHESQERQREEAERKKELAYNEARQKRPSGYNADSELYENSTNPKEMLPAEKTFAVFEIIKNQKEMGHPLFMDFDFHPDITKKPKEGEFDFLILYNIGVNEVYYTDDAMKEISDTMFGFIREIIISSGMENPGSFNIGIRFSKRIVNPGGKLKVSDIGYFKSN